MWYAYLNKFRHSLAFAYFSSSIWVEMNMLAHTLTVLTWCCFSLSTQFSFAIHHHSESIRMIVGNVVNNMHVWACYARQRPTTSCNKSKMKSKKEFDFVLFFSPSTCVCVSVFLFLFQYASPNEIHSTRLCIDAQLLQPLQCKPWSIRD